MRINDIFTATYSPGSDPLFALMKSKVVLLIWCGVLAFAVRAGETSPRYANPVIPKNFPDPTFWTGNDGWVYGVATGPSTIHRSRDLVTWEDTGVPPIEPKSLAELKKFSGHFWAPDVAKVNGRYLLYITQFVSSERNRLVVLECDRPTGPFALRNVVLENWKFGKCDLGIDADVVPEGDSLWLFVGSVAGGVWRTKLTPDGLRLDEAAGLAHVAGLIPDDPNARGWIYSNRCYEGSYLYRRGKWWYLFVSCGSISGGSYKLCCGRSETLAGDFVDKAGKLLREGGGEVLLKTVPGSDFSGCGHNGEIFADRNGRTYMFVHSQWKGTGGENWRSGPRCTSLQEVRWDDDGWPWFETGTLKGEETKPCYSAPTASAMPPSTASTFSGLWPPRRKSFLV